MQRRSLLRSAGLGGLALALPPLATPGLGQGSRASTLRFVPQANLTALDPIWTSAIVTQIHGYHVYDTLYHYLGTLD